MLNLIVRCIIGAVIGWIVGVMFVRIFAFIENIPFQLKMRKARKREAAYARL